MVRGDFVYNKEFIKSEKLNIEIPTICIEPEIKEEENSTLTHKIAEFSTDVSDSTGGRKSNVKLALSSFSSCYVECSSCSCFVLPADGASAPRPPPGFG